MAVHAPTPHSTDVLELLAAQRAELERLIARAEDVHGDVRAAFDALAHTLAAHVAAKQHAFYPAAVAHGAWPDKARDDHMAIKRVLADLLLTDVDDATFQAKLAVLKARLDRHVDDEDRELWPTLRARMSTDERTAVGRDVRAIFDEMMQVRPPLSVPMVA